MRVSIALLAAVPFVFSVSAEAAVDDKLAEALSLESQSRMPEAYSLLAPLTAERAGDPDFDYALGLAASDTGHVAEAILAFQRVLAIQPTNAPARAELARAYAISGDVDTAKAQFDTVIDDPSLPDPVRQRFNRIARDLRREQQGGGSSLTGFAEISGGLDSNINTATALTSITLPIFAGLGPASLSGGATRQDGTFVGGDAGISVASGVSRQDRLFASILGSIRDNIQSQAFDQAVGTATAGLGHTLVNRDVASISAQYQQFWLGHSRYRQAYGPTAQYTHRLSGGRAISASVQWLRLNYRTDPLRDADRFTGSITYAGKISYAAISVGHEEARATVSDNLSNSFAGARGGIEVPVGRIGSITATLGAEHRRYDADDTLFLKKRHDTQFDASFGMRVMVLPRIYLRPTIAYTRNLSNIGLFDYSRILASTALRVEF